MQPITIDAKNCTRWHAPVLLLKCTNMSSLECTNAPIDMHQCLHLDAPMPALRCTDACVKMHQCLRWDAPIPLLKWNTCWIYFEERHGLWSERRRKSKEKTGKIWRLSEVSHSRAPAYPLLVVHGHGIYVFFGLFPQHLLHGEPFFW